MTPSRRIGFISTRFAGTDGVSLETAKWAAVLARMDHRCYYFSGQSDRPPEVSHVVPEASFSHPAIEAINDAVYRANWGEVHRQQPAHPEVHALHQDFFSMYIRPARISAQVRELTDHLKEELYKFAHRFQLEVLIAENALSIPMNLPLGLALTEFIAETGFPVIAHHHDFSWERQRFLNNSVRDYLAAAFPPDLPSIRHVVLNSIQARRLAQHIGAAAMVVPNVMDFENAPEALDEYALTARADLGIQPGEYFILQPTRIVQRKGIEHAIELTETDQHDRLEHRGQGADGRKIYTLEDIYPQADLVTYPSAIEGFGNAFLEALYYRRPIVVNNYSIYKTDIKPKGFQVIEFDGYITTETLEQARHALTHPDEVARQAEANFSLARRYFSYAVLERRLHLLLADCFGEEV